MTPSRLNDQARLEAIASQNLAAMLACPNYNPTRQEGEDHVAACARRACDYAEALIEELNRRQQKRAEAKP